MIFRLLKSAAGRLGIDIGTPDLWLAFYNSTKEQLHV